MGKCLYRIVCRPFPAVQSAGQCARAIEGFAQGDGIRGISLQVEFRDRFERDHDRYIYSSKGCLLVGSGFDAPIDGGGKHTVRWLSESTLHEISELCRPRCGSR